MQNTEEYLEILRNFNHHWKWNDKKRGGGI